MITPRQFIIALLGLIIAILMFLLPAFAMFVYILLATTAASGVFVAIVVYFACVFADNKWQSPGPVYKEWLQLLRKGPRKL